MKLIQHAGQISENFSVKKTNKIISFAWEKSLIIYFFFVTYLNY